MKTLLKYFTDEDKRTVLFLVLSFFSLVVSFFEIGKLPFDAAWAAIILCGVPIIKGAIIGLVTEFDIKADVLVALALVATVIIGETFAAGEVAFIMALGAMLEERTVAKARTGIEKLVQLTPRTARILANGSETIVSAEEVKVGDVLRVLPGETIAVDGEIVSGKTSINQAVMTGESLPVDKSEGDEVSSGTVNQFGAFEMRATKVGEDSSIQRMVRLVESADAGKAKIVGLADKWATWIVFAALITAVFTWFFTGEAIRGVTVLVVFCPCALVLATPTAIMAGIGNATKYGILIREGDALERLAMVTKIAFDKTGTLTYGKPQVVAVESFSSSLSSDKLLELAASAEMRSEHPLGKAILSHYKTVNSKQPLDPYDFVMKAGRGVSALVDGKRILAGNAELLAENKIEISTSLKQAAETYLKDGCTVIYLAVNAEEAGFIALADVLRHDSAEMIKKITKIKMESVLLTGDHKEAAKHIADKAGIHTVHYECLPEDKMFYIDKYRRQNRLVCMVGDGINDAPALKCAHVGVAMGGIGSDIAVDAADIALVGDDIKVIPHLLKLAKKTMSTINLNIILSLILNFVAIIYAVEGSLTPVMGALVHNLGSVAVVINSALLLNYKSS